MKILKFLIIFLLLFSGICLASNFDNFFLGIARNNNILIEVTSRNKFGNLIADVISLNISINYDDPTIKIDLSKLPKPGEKLGQTEVVSIKVLKEKYCTNLELKVQSFIPPKFQNYVVIGEIEIFYTCDRFWSVLDNQFIYDSLEVGPIKYYQTQSDPSGEVELKQHLDLEDIKLCNNNILYLIAILGIVLIISSFKDEIKTMLISKKVSWKKDIKFLKWSLKQQQYLDVKEFCKKLNDIYNKINYSSNSSYISNMLKWILYENYKPSTKELKRLTELLLKQIERRKNEF